MSKAWNRFKLRALTKLWPLGDAGKRAARLPVLDRTVGPILWNERNLDATYIPVGEAVEVQPGNAIPYRLIAELVEGAAARFIMDGCMCRNAHSCEQHPRDVGCLFLGEAALDIDPALGRRATAEEALGHVQTARGAGLMPCVVHSSFDATLFSIDYRRMLAVCFCCDCCCTFRAGMRGGPVSYRERILPLPGLVMTSVGDCSGCEKCARACFLGAITVAPDGGPAFASFCKGCGRCADACPRGNIRIHFDPAVDTRRALLDRIRARTDIT